jgi:hypothetical protein
VPIAAEAIASNVFALWAARQATLGTPATDADKKLRHVDGALAIQRDLASVSFGDGRRFANGTDYTNTLVGGGSPVVHCQPGAGAWLLAQAPGTDTFTAAAGGAPARHVIVPGNAPGAWLTFWTTVGVGGTAVKQVFGDTAVSSITLAASQNQKDARVTAALLSLDPGVVYDVDPTVADDGEEPFLYTQAEGTFNIDGLGAGAITTVSEASVTWTDGRAPWYGDSIRPRAVVPGRGDVACNFTLLLDDTTLPIFNLIHYGTETPAPGTRPQNTVHYGSLDFTMAYGTGVDRRSCRIEVLRVAYRTDVAVAGRVDGGPIEMAIGGVARYPTTGPITRVTFENADAAAYVA